MSWPAISGAFALVLLSFVALTAVIAAIQNERAERAERRERRELDERDTRLGRALREAAGSEREAELQIENVRLDAALCRKFGEEFTKRGGLSYEPMARANASGALRTEETGATGLPPRSNVTRLVPRIVSGGVPLHFDNDKGAA